MSEALILMGAMSIGVERWTEIWMNILKANVKRPRPGQNRRQVLFRVAAIGFGVTTGIVVMFVANVDLLSAALPEVDFDNGKLLSGILVGLGAAPTHEVIKFIEEKKNRDGGKPTELEAEAEAQAAEKASGGGVS